MSFLKAGYEGSLLADALAMPVHWYYDRDALRRDYGTVDHFMPPRNPHPGSILWRSSYSPPNERGDILREHLGRAGVVQQLAHAQHAAVPHEHVPGRALARGGLPRQRA